MDFQLNLLLNLVDNMSSGISSAVGGLENLQNTAEGVSNSMNAMANTTMLNGLSSMLNQIGNTSINMGANILSGFGKALQGVQETGSEFESFRITLNALLGDETKAETALSKLMDFAARTPFEINDLTGMFTTITANGLDAFQMLESGMDGANNKLKDGKQELMAYIGDLMAFRPDVPAMQWATAIRNAFSGEVRSLKNALDVNVTELIGRDWGDTPEQIAKDFRDLADALKVTGLMGGNMNTLNQSLSNLDDQFTRLKLAIGDSGVFKVLSEAITNVTRAFSDLTDGEIKNFAQSVSQTFNQLLTPIAKFTKMLGNLIKSFVRFTGQHPKLAKVVMTFTALAGVGLIGAGVILKLSSAFVGIISLMTYFKVVGVDALGALRSGFTKLGSQILPITTVISALAFAWNKDLFNIRSTTVDAVNNISSAWNIAKENVSGSVGDMMNAYNTLAQKDDFTSNLTRGFMKLQVVMSALVELWNSEDGYTLSEETFQKVDQLGLRPLIEAVLDLKYRFSEFKKGFIKGWTEIVDKTKKIGKQIADTISKHFKGTFIEDALDGIKNFLKLLTNNDAKAWNNIGEALGKVTAVVLPMIVGFKALQKVISPFKKVGGILTPIVGGVVKLGKAISPFSNKKGLMPPLFEGGSSSSSGGGMLSGNPKSTVTAMGNLAIIITGVTSIVEAYGVLSKSATFTEFLSSGASTLMELMKAIIPIISVAGTTALLLKGFSTLKLDSQAVIKGMQSIALSLGGITVIVDAIGAIQSIPNFSTFMSTGLQTIYDLRSVLVPLAEVSAVVGVALLGFSKLTSINPSTIKDGLKALAESLLGITVIIDAIGVLQSLPLFNEFLSSGATTLTKIANTLGGMFNAGGASLVATFGVIAGLSKLNSGTILNGMKILAECLGGITLIISAFGALAQIDGFNEFLASGGETLSVLFEQVGKVAGALVGGFLGGTVKSALPSIGEGLSQFANTIKPFFDVVSSVPLDNVSKFLNAIANITGTLTGDSIAGFFGGNADFDSLGEDLGNFGNKIKPFFASIASVNEDGMKKAPQVFKALSSIGNSEFKSGGLKGLLGGNTDLGNIGGQLADFTEGIGPFFEKASNLPEKGLTNAPKVFDALKGIGNSSFKSGTFDFLSGDSLDLEGVGEQLSSFASSSTQFFVFASSLDASAISNTSSMFSALGKLKDIPNLSSSGIASLPTTGTYLTNFATNSRGFFTFAGSLGETVASKVNAIITSISKMQGMVNVAKSSNGSLATFSMELTKFASGLITFNNKFAGVKNFNGITSLGNMLKQLATVFNSTKSTITSGARGMALSMSEITSSFSKAVTSLDKSTSKMKTTISTMITSVKKDISNLVTSFRNTKFNFTKSHIQVPHFSMSGSFDAKTKKVPSVSTKWYQTGGVFDSPSIIGVGENGSEAVMPLEKNIGWIDTLASKINDVRSVPSGNNTSTFNYDNSVQPTTTNNNQSVQQGDIDNSVVFSEGSIVINASGSSEQDAERLAELIIQKIKRKKQISDLMNYKDLNSEELVLV